MGPSITLWAVRAVPFYRVVEEVISASLLCAWFLYKQSLPIYLLFEGTDVLACEVSSLLLGLFSDQHDDNQYHSACAEGFGAVSVKAPR